MLLATDIKGGFWFISRRKSLRKSLCLCCPFDLERYESENCSLVVMPVVSLFEFMGAGRGFNFEGKKNMYLLGLVNNELVIVILQLHCWLYLGGDRIDKWVRPW